MDGIINIYKEAGYTSHDVVAKLRGILGQKKIGHTGTLDPMATGVLPVCLGKATRVCDLLTSQDKTYQAVCRLGVVTDTQDLTGTVLEENATRGLTEAQVTETVRSFLGEHSQVPPMYSAIKVGGKKLYELAREGIEVKRSPRNIVISDIKILQMNLEEQTFSMEVTCSKGTYIRTLCHDIGQKLSVGAALQDLVRTRVGPFKIADAVTLEELTARFCGDREEPFDSLICPIDALFDEYPRLKIRGKYETKLANGNILREDSFVPYRELPKEGDDCLVYDTHGGFKAIYRKTGMDYTVIKMF